MKKNYKTFLASKTLIYLFVILLVSLSTQEIQAQIPGDPSNFDIRGNVYSGTPTSVVDDWFEGVTGIGVIDETNTAANTVTTTTLANTPFIEGMSLPQYSVDAGYILYDAVYGRDYANLSGSSDGTAFTGGSTKNGTHPVNDWVAFDGNVLSKNDLVDVYAHIRRNGNSVDRNMWIDMALSTLGTNGSHFVDFELFKSEIALNGAGNGFVNSGPDEGHTSWTFDGSGDVTATGDIVIGFEFNGANVNAVDVRVWTSRNDFNNTTPTLFSWGASFDGSGNGSTYGYAQVILPAGVVFTSGSATSTPGPPWGTLDTSGPVVTPNYSVGSFAEVGVDLTILGIDPSLESGGNPCDSPFTRVLVKSRTSASFTSALKDFAGPYAFATTPTVDATITDPGAIICTNETVTLEVANPSTSSTVYYEWTTTDGLFSNGTQSSVGTSAVVTQPGTYTLNAAPFAGCTATTESVTLIGDNVLPTITCPTTGLAQNVDDGGCTYTGTYAATFSDNCPDVAVAYSVGGSTITFPYVFPLGSTTVTAIATDTASLTASCTFDVVVSDPISPVIVVPATLAIDGVSTSAITAASAEFAYNTSVTTIYSDPITAAELTTFNGLTGYSVSDGNNNIESITYQDAITSTDNCPIVVTRTFTVTDCANNTGTDTLEITISPATALSVTASTTQPVCLGDTGSIDITAVGGNSSSYTYAWTTTGGSGLVVADEDQTGLTTGTYNVTVTDANGCTTTLSSDVTINTPPDEADLSLVKNAEDSSGNTITTINIGQTIYYSIVLTNGGPCDATGVTVEDILPSGVSYDSGNSTIPTGTTFTVNGSNVGTWDLSGITFANGTTTELIIAVTVGPNCEDITNIAEIMSSDQTDPDSIPNSGD